MKKTVKELAEELNVSKSYVDKVIRKLELHTELDMVGNKYVISKEQEDIILEAFKRSKATIKMRNNSTAKLDSEVAFLRDQLANKNEEMKKMQLLLDQQQKLQLKTQQMLAEKTFLLEEQQKKAWWQFWK